MQVGSFEWDRLAKRRYHRHSGNCDVERPYVVTLTIFVSLRRFQDKSNMAFTCIYHHLGYGHQSITLLLKERKNAFYFLSASNKILAIMTLPGQ